MITALPRVAIAVRDFESAVSTFRDVFGMPVLDFSARTVPDLGAHVGMCMPVGGSNIELMAPSDPSAPLSMSLQKYLDRFGDGLYALMLEAPDPNAEAEGLSARGLEVLPLMAGAGGRDLHPRSTSGVLIRVYPNDSVGQHEQQPSHDPNLTGIAKVIIATSDADKASATYGFGLGLAVGEPAVDHDHGVVRVTCTAPKGATIELVSPVDTDKPLGREIGTHLQADGDGMYALVLRADDPAAALALIEERGLPVDAASSLIPSVFGTRIIIE